MYFAPAYRKYEITKTEDALRYHGADSPTSRMAINAPERPAIKGKRKSTVRLIRFSSNEIGQIAYPLPLHVGITICKMTIPR
ncbi:uncharacterized protein METZ01_LOCUS213252 [marine metagenome]|uniref:Uncharacterized protein n=1 Tax=marine metagenome TaxID=408172 RepID=A0A382FBD0_9ZZZZ